MDQIVSQFDTIEAQKCYHLGDFGINLLFKGGEIFSNKAAKTANKEMPLLTKGYCEFCFYNSLEQIIISPTRTTALIEQQLLWIRY